LLDRLAEYKLMTSLFVVNGVPSAVDGATSHGRKPGAFSLNKIFLSKP